MGLINKIIGVAYFIIALYIANNALNFITMPGFIVSLETWILIIGAVVIVVEGVKALLKKPSTIL